VRDSRHPLIPAIRKGHQNSETMCTAVLHKMMQGNVRIAAWRAPVRLAISQSVTLIPADSVSPSILDTRVFFSLKPIISCRQHNSVNSRLGPDALTYNCRGDCASYNKSFRRR
jgi:hypothetical protein